MNEQERAKPQCVAQVRTPGFAVRRGMDYLEASARISEHNLQCHEDATHGDYCWTHAQSRGKPERNAR